jgi:hypothetical protein
MAMPISRKSSLLGCVYLSGIRMESRVHSYKAETAKRASSSRSEPKRTAQLGGQDFPSFLGGIELDRKTHTLIEQIRERLLKNFLSDPDNAASWAESVDPTLATLPQRPSRSLM